MILPTSLVTIFTMIGLVSFSSILLWSLPKIWYRIKYKKFQNTREELKYQNLLLKLHSKKLEKEIKEIKSRNTILLQEQKETLDKLVSKI